jgi:hypothetical protein
LPETHFLAILNNSLCSKPVLLSNFEVFDREIVSEYQFLVLVSVTIYIL